MPSKPPNLTRLHGLTAYPPRRAIRAAIAEHIEKRRRDPAFQARLRRILEEERVVLERLAQ